MTRIRAFYPCLVCPSTTPRHPLDFELRSVRYGVPRVYVTCTQRLARDVRDMRSAPGVGVPALVRSCEPAATAVHRAAYNGE